MADGQEPNSITSSESKLLVVARSMEQAEAISGQIHIDHTIALLDDQGLTLPDGSDQTSFDSVLVALDPSNPQQATQDLQAILDQTEAKQIGVELPASQEGSAVPGQDSDKKSQTSEVSKKKGRKSSNNKKRGLTERLLHSRKAWLALGSGVMGAVISAALATFFGDAIIGAMLGILILLVLLLVVRTEQHAARTRRATSQVAVNARRASARSRQVLQRSKAAKNDPQAKRDRATIRATGVTVGSSNLTLREIADSLEQIRAALPTDSSANPQDTDENLFD